MWIQVYFCSTTLGSSLNFCALENMALPDYQKQFTAAERYWARYQLKSTSTENTRVGGWLGSDSGFDFYLLDPLWIFLISCMLTNAILPDKKQLRGAERHLAKNQVKSGSPPWVSPKFCTLTNMMPSDKNNFIGWERGGT